MSSRRGPQRGGRAWRRRPAAFVALALSVALGTLASGVTLVAAQTAEDPSDVVLVFDVSDSIVQANDGTNTEFASALTDIADRVGDIATDLEAGNATVSFVAFARTAIPYPDGCSRLQLHDNAAAVASFEDCLRKISAEYAAGRNAPIQERIGTASTDHVAALQEAESLLTDESTRSAVIFFTDGEHNPPGTARDNEDVVAKVTPFFEGRSPFAILPVGLGTRAGGFQTELQAIYDGFLRDMAPCEGRSSFAWPQVVFPSAEEAGSAVALGLQEVTCSFTVAPTPVPTIPPTPSPKPTLAPTPTPTPTAPPVVVAPGCAGSFFDCNPWAIWGLAGAGILAVLVALLSSGRLYIGRNRVWVTAQVDGGANRPLGWGPKLDIGLEQDEDGWYAVKRPAKSALIHVRYQGNNRFLVQSSAGARDVHQGDPATVREGQGESHQLILRRYARRTSEVAPASRAPAPADRTGSDVVARLDREKTDEPPEEELGPYVG